MAVLIDGSSRAARRPRIAIFIGAQFWMWSLPTVGARLIWWLFVAITLYFPLVARIAGLSVPVTDLFTGKQESINFIM